MPFSLDDETRVSIPSSTINEIASLNRDQSEYVQTQLLKITEAGYTPDKLVYKHYGDLKVFRCGGEMRLFGVILENISVVPDLDHVVILLEVSEHEYDQAGVEKSQARRLQSEFSGIQSQQEFYHKLDGKLFSSDDIRRFIT